MSIIATGYNANMSSIGDILKNRNVQQPPEIAIIKNYISEKYDSDCSVTVREKSISIGVPSAALANTLRHDKSLIDKLIGNQKTVSFRIHV